MDILLGIDFGTTNTVITYFENNKVNIVDGNFCESNISFMIDNTIHHFSKNNDEIIYEKSGVIKTKIVFNESKKTEFVYEIEQVKNKIYGEVKTISII